MLDASDISKMADARTGYLLNKSLQTYQISSCSAVLWHCRRCLHNCYYCILEDKIPLNIGSLLDGEVFIAEIINKLLEIFS
jgi:hypothetical protein